MKTHLLFLIALLVSLTTSVTHAQTTYLPTHYLPASTDGTPTTVQWIHGATLVVKDNFGTDLVAIFKGTSSLHAAASSDDGSTWHWVNSSTSTSSVDAPVAIAQSADGNLHMLSWSWGHGGPFYSRLLLSRDIYGHLVDFSVAANFKLATGLNYSDLSGDIVAGADANGDPSLFFAVYEDRGSGGRVLAGKTTATAGVAPTATAHFVGLSTTALTVLDSSSNAWASPHNAAVFLAQHPVSRDLWFQWGPLNTGDGLTSNNLPLRRVRVTGSGSTFTVGTIVNVATFSGGYGAQNYAAVASANYVWFAHGSPASAVNIDRADASGAVTSSVVPSPYSLAHSGGFFTLGVSSNETELWLAGQIAEDGNDPHPMARMVKRWDGTTWTSFTPGGVSDELFRICRSSGWGNGLVFVQSRFDYSSWRPAIGVLRTLTP